MYVARYLVVRESFVVHLTSFDDYVRSRLGEFSV